MYLRTSKASSLPHAVAFVTLRWHSLDLITGAIVLNVYLCVKAGEHFEYNSTFQFNIEVSIILDSLVLLNSYDG